MKIKNVKMAAFSSASLPLDHINIHICKQSAVMCIVFSNLGILALVVVLGLSLTCCQSFKSGLSVTRPTYVGYKQGWTQQQSREEKKLVLLFISSTFRTQPKCSKGSQD